MEFLFQGYNVTFFAYGMTGAGKTHTIFGNSNNNSNSRGSNMEHGTCQLTMKSLFKKFNEAANH